MDCLTRLRVAQCVHVGMIQTRRKDDFVGVEPLRKVLFQFLRRGENLRPMFVLLCKVGAEIFHLVLVARCQSPGHAASHIRAFCGARAKCNMDIVCVVVKPVGVTDRISWMKSLAELPHDLLQSGLQHAVRSRRLGFETQCFVQKWRNAISLWQSSLRGTARLGIFWICHNA